MTTSTHQTQPTPLRLAVIVASVRQGRFAPVVSSWTRDRAVEHGGFDVDVIDLADVPLPLDLPAESPAALGDDYPRPPEMADLTARLDAADAFVIVTPEYNHSYPASLKAAIDWHFTQWQAKPVGFVTYGGAAGGRHAVLHLENVLTELHAVTVRNSVSFPLFWERFGADGQPLDPATADFAKLMLDQLAWWAEALRTARAVRPYAA